MRRLLKLLYPGLGVKRWLLLMLFGLLVFLAALFVLFMGIPGLKGLAELVYARTEAAFGPEIWGLLLLLVGGLEIGRAHV